MPSGKAHHQLKEIISSLSEKYQSPDFEPHVTLLESMKESEEKMILETSKLADFIKPYRINLGLVDYLNIFFRCLFIRALKTREVMNANLKTREIFNRKDDPEYMPHLSLLYGNLDTETKKKIISEIGNKFEIGFDVNSIHLFLTEDEPENWTRVKEFDLRG